MAQHFLHAQFSKTSLFIVLYHIIDGHRVELGYITRAPEGLVFNAAYRCALDANQLAQISEYMIDHRNEPISMKTPVEIEL